MQPKTIFKPAILLLLLSIISNLVNAQTPPPKQWNKKFGGRWDEFMKCVKQTTDGGYILGGYSSSGIDGDKTEASRGEVDYWIVKTDAKGIKQWDKTFGGSSNDYLYDLQQTSDGGYILGGHSESGISGDKTEGSRGILDYWIVKTDANGVKQWDKRFGGTNVDYLYSLQQTSDGGYILGGYSYSGIGGDKTEANRGMAGFDTDYWMVKINANGIKQWDKTFGGTSSEDLRSLQQTSDGGYILGGRTNSAISGDVTEAKRGGTDYWIVKTDANGIKQWDKRFGGPTTNSLFDLQQTTDGGYILGGESSSGIGSDKTEMSRGSSDYWIVKTDPNGVKQWDKTFGGSYIEWFTSIQQTSDRGYILGGYSASGISGDKTEASRGGLTDYWIVKTNANGEKEWDKRFGGSDGDYLNSLQQTSDGGYILGGFSNSHISGDLTASGNGLSDYWIVKLGCPPSARITYTGSLDICQTGSVTFTAEENTGVKYQWYKDDILIQGAKNISYTATMPGKYKYTVRIGSKPECVNTSLIRNVTNSCGKTVNALAVFPNPSKGNITVTYNSSNAGNVQLQVLDKAGRVMYAGTKYAIKGANSYQLNLSHLINGVYNLQLSSGSAQNQVNIIIQK